jgi:hypothetical protein
MAKPAPNHFRLLGHTCDLLVAEVSNEQRSGVCKMLKEQERSEVLVTVGRAGSARRR